MPRTVTQQNEKSNSPHERLTDLTQMARVSQSLGSKNSTPRFRLYPRIEMARGSQKRIRNKVSGLPFVGMCVCRS